MAQIDKLNYLPLLCWFLLLFVYLYFILFTRFLPLLFSALKTRSLFFKGLLQEIISVNGFFFFFSFISKSLLSFKFIFNFILASFFFEVFFFKLNISTIFLS